MSFFVIARSFLRNLFLSDRVDADLDEEVHSHLKVLARQNLHAGMQEVEAQRRARIEQFKEQVREERLGNWLHSIVSDFRFTLRQLRKSPGFTAVAILTLALGIGGTTAIFTLVHEVMLRSLAVAKPDQLWRVGDAVFCCFSDGYTQGETTARGQRTTGAFSRGRRTSSCGPTLHHLRIWLRSRLEEVTRGWPYDAPVRRARSQRAMASTSPEISSRRSAFPLGVGGCSPMPTTRKAHRRSRS